MIKKVMQAIIVLAFFSHPILSQNTLDFKCNALRADSMIYEIIPTFDAGCEGENVMWDVSETIEKGGIRQNSQIYSIADMCVKDFNGTLTSYAQSKDSLLLFRSETPSYQMNYSMPIVTLKFPFKYGDSVNSTFTGRGDYEGKLLLDEVGNAKVKADAYGSIILNECDTIHNVLRVSSQFKSDIAISSSINNEDYGVLQKYTDIYEWYAQGYRYPLLKSYEERICKEGKLLRTSKYSLYFSPEEQSNLEDIENEDIRVRDSISRIDNPIHDLVVINKGSSAIVSYTLSSDAHVSMTLANSQGMVFWRYEGDEYAENDNSHTIPLSGLHRGQYAIYIRTNNYVCSSKLVIE